MHHFWDIRLQKCCDLENRIKGRWRLLKMSPFDRQPMTSYWCSIVTMALSNVTIMSPSYIYIWDIQCWKISQPWNPSQQPTKVIKSGTIRYTGYSFLLVFYSNFVPKILHFKNAVSLKTELWVHQGHRKCHHSIEHIWLPIDVL